MRMKSLIVFLCIALSLCLLVGCNDSASGQDATSAGSETQDMNPANSSEEKPTQQEQPSTEASEEQTNPEQPSTEASEEQTNPEQPSTEESGTQSEEEVQPPTPSVDYSEKTLYPADVLAKGENSKRTPPPRGFSHPPYKKKKTAQGGLFFLVETGGLEPSTSRM